MGFALLAMTTIFLDFASALVGYQNDSVGLTFLKNWFDCKIEPAVLFCLWLKKNAVKCFHKAHDEIKTHVRMGVLEMRINNKRVANLAIESYRDIKFLAHDSMLVKLDIFVKLWMGSWPHV